MLQCNVDKVLSILDDSHVVLDIGGWACPFNRANFVVDVEPYETRRFYGTMGGPSLPQVCVNYLGLLK